MLTDAREEINPTDDGNNGSRIFYMPNDEYAPRDNIFDMSEDQYDNMIERRSLNKIMPRLIMNEHVSDKQYNWIKNAYRWSSKKEYSGSYENANFHRLCISTIVDYLSSKMLAPSKSFEDDEIFEEFIVLKKLNNSLLIERVFVMIHLYPADKFDHYWRLILEHYDLHKVFGSVSAKPPFCQYSLDTLNIIVNCGVKLNFEELLTQCCICTIENDLRDKIYYAIDNLEMDNLSVRTVAIIYNSVWLETIISRTDSKINFASWGSLHLLGTINREKVDALTKYGYDFKEMLDVKTSTHAGSCEQTDRSAYLKEFLEDMNFDNAILKQILHRAICTLYLTY